MFDGRLEYETRQETADVLVALAEDVRSMVKSGNITYDNYINLQIKHFKGQDTDFIRSLVRQHFESEGDARQPDTWTKTNSLVETVKAININYVCLLTDPLIAIRSEQFIEYARQKPLLSPEQLRRDFIDSFPTKTYYRGVVLTQNNGALPNSHLAPKLRSLVDNTDTTINEYLRDVEETMGRAQRRNESESNEYLYNLPILNRFSENIWRHVTSRRTQSDYISISERPEIAWYVLCDNNKDLWRQWEPGRFLRVFKFEMNSFYAPSSRDTAYRNVSEEKIGNVTIEAEDNTGKFVIRAADQQVEQLVPISLPQDFDLDYRDYTPNTDNISHKPTSFQISRETDW